MDPCHMKPIYQGLSPTCWLATALCAATQTALASIIIQALEELDDEETATVMKKFLDTVSINRNKGIADSIGFQQGACPNIPDVLRRAYTYVTAKELRIEDMIVGGGISTMLLDALLEVCGVPGSFQTIQPTITTRMADQRTRKVPDSHNHLPRVHILHERVPSKPYTTPNALWNALFGLHKNESRLACVFITTFVPSNTSFNHAVLAIPCNGDADFLICDPNEAEDCHILRQTDGEFMRSLDGHGIRTHSMVSLSPVYVTNDESPFGEDAATFQRDAIALNINQWVGNMKGYDLGLLEFGPGPAYQALAKVVQSAQLSSFQGLPRWFIQHMAREARDTIDSTSYPGPFPFESLVHPDSEPSPEASLLLSTGHLLWEWSRMPDGFLVGVHPPANGAASNPPTKDLRAAYSVWGSRLKPRAYGVSRAGVLIGKIHLLQPPIPDALRKQIPDLYRKWHDPAGILSGWYPSAAFHHTHHGPMHIREVMEKIGLLNDYKDAVNDWLPGEHLTVGQRAGKEWIERFIVAPVVGAILLHHRSPSDLLDIYKSPVLEWIRFQANNPQALSLERSLVW